MEPGWLQKRRERSHEAFATLPLPTQEETWRRIDLDRVPFDKFPPDRTRETVPPRQSARVSAIRVPAAQVPGVPLSGNFQLNCGCEKAHLEEGLLRQGVRFLSLRQAIAEEERVENYFGRWLGDPREKFLSQNEANWNQGVFLYIPPDVTLPSPLLIHSHFSSQNSSFFPRTLVILDQRAQATLIIQSTSETDGGANYINDLEEFYLESGAKLNLIHIQSLGPTSFELSRKHVELGPQSSLKWFFDMRGGSVSKSDVDTVLLGEGATAEVFGLVRGTNNQYLEVCSQTHHIARHTTGNILVKTTVQGEAKTTFQGMIRIEKTAEQTDTYMANHNLVLGAKARADSIPRLEIEADDVRASHGVTIGQVDPEQLFYLRSRGLEEEGAQQLLIDGFYQDVFERIPNDQIREWMRSHLHFKGLPS